jgi:putative hydrolase of the HAD superfamily
VWSRAKQEMEIKMDEETNIKCLFLDIGGVLLSNGWDGDARRKAALTFDLDFSDMNDRHRILFATYEEGKLTLDEYLRRTVFFEKRPFTQEQFRKFMFEQSKADPEMLELVRALKTKYGLKTVVVSNEARELNAFRIRNFKLDEFIDAFVSSCFVGMRKPDPHIFRVALDIAQVAPSQIVYIENTAIFVDIAKEMGLNGILHTDHGSTRVKLEAFGLRDDKGFAGSAVRKSAFPANAGDRVSGFR